MKSDRRAQAKWIESRQRWQINVQAEGERRTFSSSKQGPRGRVEAERKADMWLERRLMSENTSFDAVAKEYLESIDKSESSSYYRQQEQYIRNHVLPALRKKKISKITENDLQKVIDAAHKKGLSRKTLSNLRGCLMAIIKYARKGKYTDLRPEDLKIPASAPRSSKKILSQKDLKTLLTCDQIEVRGKLRQDWFIHAYRLQVLLGLRPGEAIGLRWGDIKNGILHVQRSINCAGEITSGKNDNADRYIALDGLAAAEIEAQKQQLIDAGVPMEWVFPVASTLSPPCQNHYYLSFKRYQMQHNFSPVVSPYELRHTYVSVTDEMPEGLKKKTIGHSKSMDTEGVYGHRKAGDMQRAAAFGDAAFQRILDGGDTGN